MRPDRKQQVLFGYSLDEFVSADAKCRFVVDVVGRLDLSAVYADYSRQGGDAYDPAMMLATWFLAYSEGVTTTRELERRCQRDTHYIFVTGNLHPDHTSLSRFRKRHVDRLPDLFVQIVRLAQKEGVSEFRTICVDGTRLKANASPGKSLLPDEIRRRIEKTRESIEAYLRQCDLSDADVTDEQKLRLELAALKEKQRIYEQRLAEVEDRSKDMQPNNRKRHRINLTDPDALKMKLVNGRRGIPAYNGQVSVDAESGLIVAAEGVTDANDSGQFARQHAQVEENLGPDPDRTYVADKGYHTYEQLEYIRDNEIDAVIDDPRPNRGGRTGTIEQRVELKPGERVKRSDFIYDPEEDVYICPEGCILTRRTTWTDAYGNTFDVYGRACRNCPRRKLCIGRDGTGTFRRVFRNVKIPLANAMLEKIRSEKGKKLLNTRFSTVETVFGNMKENMGFRGVRMRGIRNVAGEFSLMCIGHNLNRMFTLTEGKLETGNDRCNRPRTAPRRPIPARMAPLSVLCYPKAA